MKKNVFALLLLLFFVSSFVHAQDKIILLAGDTIYATIKQVTSKEITYKPITGQDSLITLSNSYIRKIIYQNGEEEIVRHFEKKSVATVEPIENLSTSKKLVINGNSYYYHGISMHPRDLGSIYSPLNDKELNLMYENAMKERALSMTLRFLPIPLGVAGYCLCIFSTISTTSTVSGADKQYGNHNLMIPGVILLGAALTSGMIAIGTNASYKVKVRKSALHYNHIIESHNLN